MSRLLLTMDPDLAEMVGDIASVSVRDACLLVPAGITKIYDLINSGQLESFLDGKSRRITLRSIKARRDRLLRNDGNTPGAVAADRSAPRRRGRPRKLDPRPEGAGA
jgi:hypothetical protein